ncbi:MULTISPECIES: lipopolysaccharide assembly protein LapB [unclassified Pseudoalteromonas]|uniref:lipopolysaccharide assembly protein LapB n=1 Tax=unclassified Pseudoalteromonas TaxID=194690 RepID=UPI0020981A0F|nr:lipopolysaccharide assembly protein LapB [Pseudoalteromonas sp. XMcav2-N]MCO7187718.1 lipopolysaccharide assembly protein LapB [Pseudoalteromonas sp. XMcav2-N]
MIELLFLLLPVAAAYGYVMGKNSAKNQAHEQNRKITSEYSKGLKFLLDREEDQGLEHLIKLLEVSADSVEHYLILATLFRKRGELDRAIRIHELLLKQPSLDKQIIQSCKLALAEDYIMAGLLDSAEEHLVELVKADYEEALTPIIQLYSQTREWQKGVNMYESHSDLFTEQVYCAAIANFYCEAALDSQGQQQCETEYFERALKLPKTTIRPLFELGHDALGKEDNVKAIYYWRKLVSQFPCAIPLVLQDLQTCYQRLNIEHEFYTLVNDLLNASGVLVKIKHCEGLMEAGRTEQAVEYLTDTLKREPSIRGFSFLLKLLARRQDKFQSVLNEVDNLVSAYVATKPDYQCRNCGFTSHTLYWLCPSCKSWESILPSQGVDGY